MEKDTRAIGRVTIDAPIGEDGRIGGIASNFQADFFVFIGRFQPFHLGHKRVVDTALAHGKRVIILIGSAFQPRCTKNPWNWEEREWMIRSSYDTETNERITCAPLSDIRYNDSAWISQVQSTVTNLIAENIQNENDALPHSIDDMIVSLIGCEKDGSSYYLKLFPQWTNMGVEFFEGVNATDIREEYLANGPIPNVCEKLPFTMELQKWSEQPGKEIPIAEFLYRFARTEDYARLRAEKEYFERYRASWANAPFPPVFVTGDAIVVRSGHILLVKRGRHPGKGLWAIPGGFLKQDELITDGIIRELVEETQIRIPKKILRGSIIEQRVFDDPSRSQRGRVITHAALIRLEDGKLPPVEGADDASEAKWVPIGELRQEDFFEDHYHMIREMVGFS